jgi:hypothetical protein
MATPRLLHRVQEGKVLNELLTGEDRWEDLDDSPVTWHIVGDIAGAAADNGAGFDPFITEPWQLAVNGIY